MPILVIATCQNGASEAGIICVYNYRGSVRYTQLNSSFSETTSISLSGNTITLTYDYIGVWGSAMVIAPNRLQIY